MSIGTSTQPIIRPPLRDDFDQWLGLWEGYNDFYKRVGPTAVPLEVTKMTWERFFDSYEPINALVAEQDGKLVGLVHYLFHRHSTALGSVCYLQDLFTAPSTRGKGVGRALINAVYEKAKAAGSPRVYWHTQETNDTAMILYDKLADKSGFTVYTKIF